MSLLVIDREKCKQDAICAGECPMALIRMDKESGYPEMAAGADGACLRCGHCVAVCPHGALDHTAVRIGDSPDIRKELTIGEEQAVQFLRSRRSIRAFKDRPVEKEKIQRLIEIGRYAPTSGNGQWVKWIVVTEADRIRELSRLSVEWMRKVLEKDPTGGGAPYMPLIVAAWDMGFDAILRQSPALVVAYAPKEDFNGLVDVSLALSYLELAAPTLDLGTCWAGLLQGALVMSPELKETVGIPKGHPHHYPMMLGYPKFKYHRLPERKEPSIDWK